MTRRIIRVTLALLLTLVCINILEDSGGVQADHMKEVETTPEKSLPSAIEQSQWRLAIEADRNNANGRSGVGADQMKEVETMPERSLPSAIEQPQWRFAREAGRKNANGRKNKKASRIKKMKGERKTKKTKTKPRQGNKKLRKRRIILRKTKTNRRKQKKETKNKPRKNKSRKGHKNLKRNRKMSRRNKKGSKKRQNKSKRSKQKRRKRVKKLSQHKQNSNGTACDEKALGQKIKDYIKISNQLRKVRRIKKACETMEKKANKSLNVFQATVDALSSALGSSSDRRMYFSRSRWRRSIQPRGELSGIKDKLKNCSKTAKAKCQRSSVEACQNETQLTNCEKELQSWLDKFGPAKGSCLQASDNYCPCITALPDLPTECLTFDQQSTSAINSKKKCTSGDEEGSFGFCKKLQVQAAEKGPGAGKCQNTGVVTTRPPISTPISGAIQETLQVQSTLTGEIIGVIQFYTPCTQGTIAYAVSSGQTFTTHVPDNCIVQTVTACTNSLAQLGNERCTPFTHTPPVQHTIFVVGAPSGNPNQCIVR